MTNPSHPPAGVEAYKEILIELHNERILERSHQTEADRAFYAFHTCLKQLARRSIRPGRGLPRGQNRSLAAKSAKSYCEAKGVTLINVRDLQNNIREAFVTFPRGPKESRKVVGIINKHTEHCGVKFEAEDNRWEPRFNTNDPIGTIYCALFKVLEYDISDVHLCSNDCGRFFIKRFRRKFCRDNCKNQYRKKKKT